MRKRLLFFLIGCVVLLVALIAAYGHVTAPKSGTATLQPKTTEFDTHAYSTSDPTSIWVVVNKQHHLNPKTYVPSSLVVPAITLRTNITSDERQVSSVMAPALEEMVRAAKADGLTITLESGYRSYTFQQSLYASYVARDGQAQADQESARPGYSEHQTGMAADLGGTTKPSCNVAQCFASTPEGQWLAAHAYEYGFIIRYTAAKQSVTGYEDEPWHVRYIGKDLAAELHNRQVQTLEEFFNISGGETYL